MAFVRSGNALVVPLLLSLLLCSCIAVYANEVEKKVAVEGVVYCKSCKYIGVDKLLDAAPLERAVVKLQCKDQKFSLVEETKTDKKGHFFFKPEKLTTAVAPKCKVFLVSSPHHKCSVPTNLNGGVAGAVLEHSVTTTDKKKQPLVLYTVGPFAFEPLEKFCHHH